MFVYELSGCGFESRFIHLESSDINDLKIMFTVNFGIGSAVSKDPGSAFSEGPSLGPLYRVWR